MWNNGEKYVKQLPEIILMFNSFRYINSSILDNWLKFLR